MYFVVLPLIEVVMESGEPMSDVFEGDFESFADGVDDGEDVFLRYFFVELFEFI